VIAGGVWRTRPRYHCSLCAIVAASDLSSTVRQIAATADVTVVDFDPNCMEMTAEATIALLKQICSLLGVGVDVGLAAMQASLTSGALSSLTVPR
jgi:hypothetical protein